MLKTFDVTHFRRYVTPPDNTSKQIRRFAFSVIDVYKVCLYMHAVLMQAEQVSITLPYMGWHIPLEDDSPNDIQ